MTAGHHHRVVTSLTLFVDLGLRFARAATAIAAAVSMVLLAVGWIEGRAVDVSRLGMIALPFAATLAAGWVLSRWQANGEHIAMANLGLRPASTVGVLLLVSGPLMGGATALRPPPATQAMLEVRDGVVITRLNDGETRWRWQGDRATRTTATHRDAVYGPITAPRAIAVSGRGERPRWLEFIARMLSLAALLGWLTRRAGPVDPAALCVAAAVAFGAGHLAGRL